MTRFSIVYILHRTLYRLRAFVYHWYVGSFFVIARETINVFERLDKTIAFKVTLQNITQPLYQDHTAIGHMLGFVFRFARVIFGFMVYLFLVLMSAGIYLIWISIPTYILAQVIITSPL